MKIYIGQKLQLAPETFTDSDAGTKGKKTTMTGTVVYIHPRHRYFTAEFSVRGGKIRESFIWPQEPVQ